MVHQMAQEGALWPSVMIRFGPHWCNSKITWASIVNAVLDVDTKNTIRLTCLTWLEQLKNSLAQPQLLVQAKNLIKNSDIRIYYINCFLQSQL